ncbi:hypothetical protein PV328_002610 [Microctonus aethiopoides]|uniref:Uncharacterized protein n=1 Tax=Microctonus aethiopoides TaxID=144406 RepID=A0AA39F6P4_9HYME|nr:hypothetical protein PV328_002610 [Microctonus aethiopoides]
MALQGKSSLTKSQRDKLDKILTEIPNAAWNKQDSFEKNFAETLSVFKEKENIPRPNLCTRKRKGSVKGNDNIPNDENMEISPNGEQPWEIPNKTAKIKQSTLELEDCSVSGNSQNNIYEHLLTTQDDEEVSSAGKVDSPNGPSKRPPPIHVSGIALTDLIKISNRSYASMAAMGPNNTINNQHDNRRVTRNASSQYKGLNNEQQQQYQEQERPQHKKDSKNLEELLDNLKNEIVKSVATQITSIKDQVIENT